MRKFQCLLFVLKRLYICYYIMCMTVPLNVIISLICFCFCFFFFKERFPFLHMLRLFQGNFIFGEATSSHFFRVTTSTQQLLFRSSYFFRTAAFFSIFRAVTFSQQLFFRNSFFFRAKLLQISQFLRIGSSLWQLLFGTAIFFLEELFRIKISNIGLLLPKQVLLHSISFLR